MIDRLNGCRISTVGLFKGKNRMSNRTVPNDTSIFDPQLLEEVSKMKEKNIAVEILKKLLMEQVGIYKRNNLVKSEEFSEILKKVMNSYINGMIDNEEVIRELLKIAAQIQAAKQLGNDLGLTEEEQAFYDALTRPEAIMDFYKNDELVALTRELTDTLRRSRTVDWEKREDARAKMRMMVKKLLKRYKYPPEGMDDAVQTVLAQCELWTDNAPTEPESADRVEKLKEELGAPALTAAEPKEEIK